MDERSAQEQLSEMRSVLAEAERVGNLDGPTMKLHMTQLVASLHGQIKKATLEIARLEREVEGQKGRIRGHEQTVGLIIAMIRAHNSTVRRATEVEKQQDAERADEPAGEPADNSKKRAGRKKTK